MKNITRAALIAIVPLALAVGAAFVALADEGRSASDTRAAKASGRLGILARTGAPGDKLPAEVLALPAAERFENANGARLASVSGDRRYFVVPGRGGSVCLIYVEGSGASFGSAGTCAGRPTLIRGAVYLAEPEDDGTATIAGIASDGISRASAGAASAAIVGNVFVLRGATSSNVRLEGPGVALSVDVGSFAPVETVVAG